MMLLEQTGKIRQRTRTAVEKNRCLFMIDDHPEPLQWFCRTIERVHPQWQVIVESDHQMALSRLGQMSRRLPDVISVDLGLPPRADDPDVGLGIVREIRRLFGSARVAVHSQLKEVQASVLHELVGLGVSYIRMRDSKPEEAFVAMLPWLAEGYLIYSPSVAGKLPDILPERPDPWNEYQWKIGQLVSRGLTYDAIATEITLERYDATQDETKTVSTQAVQSMIQKMATQLQNAGFLKLPRASESSSRSNIYRPIVEKFYREYHVKYRR